MVFFCIKNSDMYLFMSVFLDCVRIISILFLLRFMFTFYMSNNSDICQYVIYYFSNIRILDFNRFPIYFFEFPDGYTIHFIFNFQVTNIYVYTSLLIPTCKLIHDPNNVNFDPEKSGIPYCISVTKNIINIPSILFIPQLQYYMCSNVTGVYIRTTLRHLHDVSSPFRYLQISTRNSLKMRFCQHPSIEMYTNQNF